MIERARSYFPAAGLVALLLAAALAVSAAAGGSPARPAYNKAQAQREATAWAVTGDLKARLDAEQLWNTTAFLNAVHEHDVAVFLDAIAAAEAEAAQARAREAAQHRQRVAPATKFAPPVTPRANVGGSCGGATNGADRFIGAESGGNPNARNPSGAWGCYQIMPGTWSSSCSDLGQHGAASTDAQAQCASRLPSSSWAATGG